MCKWFAYMDDDKQFFSNALESLYFFFHLSDYNENLFSLYFFFNLHKFCPLWEHHYKNIYVLIFYLLYNMLFQFHFMVYIIWNKSI